MFYPVDEELKAWLHCGQGANGVLFKSEETGHLLWQAFQEAWSSPEGVDLKSRNWDKITPEFVMVVLTKRYDGDPFYPGVYFRERVESVIHDLLLEAPKAPVRKPGLNQHGVNLNFDTAKEKPTASKEQSGFAFAWNKTANTKGVQAVKPKFGVVTLTMPNGSEYEYSAADADRLLNECIALGLIR